MIRQVVAVGVSLLLASWAPCFAEEAQDGIEREEPGGVGGLFGLFWSEEPVSEEALPEVESRPEEDAVTGAADEARPTPEMKPPAESESEAAVEAAPAADLGTEATTDPATAPRPKPDLDADLRAARRPAPSADDEVIELPTEEIRGEIQKPDIFFLLPKARSKSDEQLIRSRIQREITRPLIKEWLEEELLLK